MRVGSMNGIGVGPYHNPFVVVCSSPPWVGTRVRVRVPAHAQPPALDRSERFHRVRLGERSPWRRVGSMNGIAVGPYSPNTAFWGF